MTLGKAIHSIRKQRGINQVELANSCGISQAALSQIENNSIKPSSKTLELICNKLDVSRSLLMVLSLEEDDVPSDRKLIYDKLFPQIKELALKLLEGKE